MRFALFYTRSPPGICRTFQIGYIEREADIRGHRFHADLRTSAVLRDNPAYHLAERGKGDRPNQIELFL